MADLKELQTGEKFAGRYRVVEPIGEGPVGKVYKALDLALDLPVAVKILNPDLFTGEFKQVNVIRLYRARAYKNPAILEILEVQPDGPVPFVTSALAQGLSLRQVMDFHHETGEAFTVMKIRSFMERLFEGVEFIHTMGVHGNIKPENIFILSTHLVIADPYYIVERRLKEGEEIPVTDFYRPAEQLEAPQEEIKASDIYSIAMVMGELVSNGPVQPGTPLSEQTPRLTGAFDSAFMRATLQNPEQRQKSTEEFAREVFTALTAVEREGLWERKHHETGSFKAVKIPEEPVVPIEKLPKIEETDMPASEEPEKLEKVKETGTPEKEETPEPTQETVDEPETQIVSEEIEEPAKEEAPEPTQETVDEPETQIVSEETGKPAKEKTPEPVQETVEEPEKAEETEETADIAEEIIVPPPPTETEETPEPTQETVDETEKAEETEETTDIAEEMIVPPPPTETEETLEAVEEVEETELEELEEIEPPEPDEYEELNDEELIEAPDIETETIEMEEAPEDTLVKSVEEVEKIAEQPMPTGKMAGFDKIVTTDTPPKKTEKDKTYLWVGVGVALLVVILALIFSGKEKNKTTKIKKNNTPAVSIKKDANIKNETKKSLVKPVKKDAVKKPEKDAVTKAIAKDAIKKDTVKVKKDAVKAKDAATKAKADAQPKKSGTKQPVKSARKPGFVYAADLKCPGNMAKVTIKKEIQEKAGLKLTKLAYCIDRYEYPGRGKMPKGSVSRGKAARLCKKAGKRLCTISEWKRACGAKYPYGSKFKEGYCNIAGSNGTSHTIVPAGTYNKCRSPYGVYDMVGNVEEWTTSGRLFGGNATNAGQTTTCSRSSKRFMPNKFSGFRCCASPVKGPNK